MVVTNALTTTWKRIIDDFRMLVTLCTKEMPRLLLGKLWGGPGPHLGVAMRAAVLLLGNLVHCGRGAQVATEPGPRGGEGGARPRLKGRRTAWQGAPHWLPRCGGGWDYGGCRPQLVWNSPGRP